MHPHKKNIIFLSLALLMPFLMLALCFLIPEPASRSLNASISNISKDIGINVGMLIVLPAYFLGPGAVLILITQMHWVAKMIIAIFYAGIMFPTILYVGIIAACHFGPHCL